VAAQPFFRLGQKPLDARVSAAGNGTNVSHRGMVTKLLALSC
jgi:hypothetical protein